MAKEVIEESKPTDPNEQTSLWMKRGIYPRYRTAPVPVWGSADSGGVYVLQRPAAGRVEEKTVLPPVNADSKSK
jgi:hypothetical protein